MSKGVKNFYKYVEICINITKSLIIYFYFEMVDHQVHYILYIVHKSLHAITISTQKNKIILKK